jgi:hypothetical protein
VVGFLVIVLHLLVLEAAEMVELAVLVLLDN